MACIKHFAGNNQEWARHSVSSDIDERTLNEIYFPAFEKAVKEALSNFTEVYGDPKGYRKYKLPATGVLLNEKNIDAMQLSMDDNI